MNKLYLFIFFTFSFGSILAQSMTITMPEKVITLYGVIEFENIYDGDFYYKIKVLNGSQTNIDELWINAGSTGEDINELKCFCESPGELTEGDKFIALVVESERVYFNYETENEEKKNCFRPIIMKKIHQ